MGDAATASTICAGAVIGIAGRRRSVAPAEATDAIGVADFVSPGGTVVAELAVTCCRGAGEGAPAW